ncbi:sterol desaturase family protein [Novosphingobium sp. CECT 9465]|uniref:sterol desaturase family protein n=1 Tax=Novosphingobium sp. CECT 9465 TaxID=2829794 RepID=UPI001E60312D|nr:sterol desaturase family protein [Novosphingobium sp. CECT 9465]
MRLAFQHPWIVAIMLALVLGEIGWRLRKGRGYDGGAAAASLGVAVGQAIFRPLTGLLTGAIFLLLADISPVQLPADNWRTWVAGFFALEFAYYWFHRFSHTVRWMWATHAVHHSAREYVLPSAIRLGWTEFFSLGWVFFAVLVLIGFPPMVVAVLLGANLIYQFPLHTEAVGRLPKWIEAVFNTPSHHRAHHASETDYLDCNFGGILIVWDRLFGTFRAEPHDRALRYGLVHDLDSRNPVHIALHEWRRLFADIAQARGASAKIKVALGRP